MIKTTRPIGFMAIVFSVSLFFSSCKKDNSSGQIILVNTTVSVGTFAGDGSEGATDGLGNVASFFLPSALALDTKGNLYVSDTGNGTIREIDRGQYVRTFAGMAGDYDLIGFPYGIAADAAGNIYVGDLDRNQIKKITAEGAIGILAGSGAIGFADGPGATASFNQPYGLAVDAAGNVYVADAGNNAIRKITPSGTVTTIAGTGAVGAANGLGVAASFNSPYGVAVDFAGNIFVADTYNQLIRKIATNGAVSTVAGGGTQDSQSPGYFAKPFGIAVDPEGNLYVADFGANQVKIINTSNQVSVLAGSGQKGATNGFNIVATFNGPSGVAVDSDGDVLVADFGNNLIRKIFVGHY